MLTTLCRSQLSDRNNAFPFHSALTDVVDCNVACLSEGIELWDGSQMSAADLRTLGHIAKGPTGNTLARRVFAVLGMQRDVDYRMLGAADVQIVRELLDDGWYLVLYVDCGWLQDHAPALVGDRRYRGAHAVALFDWWRGSAGQSVHLANPLFDGRQRGSWTAPAGVQVAKFSELRDAGYAYTGRAGILSGYAIQPSASGV
jgi:hypothetical protein